MPLRFYRRFNAGPFRINLSRSGVSSSIGVGARGSRLAAITCERVSASPERDWAGMSSAG